MKRKYLLLFSVLLLTSCQTVVVNSDSATEVPSDEPSPSETSIIESESPVESDTEEASESESESIESDSASEEWKPEYSEINSIEDYLSAEGDIPLINIHLDNNDFPVDRENYVSGDLNIVEQPNEEHVILPDTRMGLRLRGNSTFTAPKKAFRIKFDKKTSLFGLPKSKSWVLLANYFDKSNLRNYLAYQLANKLSDDFQPSFIFVDVKVNDEYLGLYLLTEQMQTGEGRVDIEGKVDSSGHSAFFVEMEDAGRLMDEGGVEDQTFVRCTNNRTYDIKYPEGEELTSDQVSFVKSTINTALSHMTQSDYANYIDEESYMYNYLVQELFKNVDCGQSSVYYYWTPDDNKLHMGPVWDFDIGLDVVGIGNYIEDYTYATYHNASLWAAQTNQDYATLLTNSLFTSRLKQYYTANRSSFVGTVDEFNKAVKLLADAQARNVAKWTLPGDLDQWISQRYQGEYEHFTTLEQHYTYLVDKLSGRITLLDNNYKI